jgi:hypothetical protein
MIIESVKESIHKWDDLMNAGNHILGHLFGYEQENLPNDINHPVNIKEKERLANIKQRP